MDSPRGLVYDASTRTLYVQHPPDITAYHDDNGDGVSDREETLVKGIGFDLSFKKGTTLGLTGMLERARGLGGELTVEAAPGRGTRVTAELPLELPVKQSKQMKV